HPTLTLCIRIAVRLESLTHRIKRKRTWICFRHAVNYRCRWSAGSFPRRTSGGLRVLTIFGERHRFCDRVSRRSFLRIGGLAMGGLSMPEIFRAEARAGIVPSKKAVIMIFLSGGPPHQDMVDLKPEAPAEFRGEFNPIATNVPGIEICEHMPLLAQMTDK